VTSLTLMTGHGQHRCDRQGKEKGGGSVDNPDNVIISLTLTW